MPRRFHVRLNDRGAALLLALIGFALYANTLGHGFVWDDKLVISNNPVTVKGWDGIWEIITTKSAIPNKNVYRPVPQVMFAVEYALAGPHPWLSHMMNALCYAALCAVVFRFLRRVFPAGPTWLLLGIGLAFAVHPLHVEVVANIKSRDEILAMLLGLLGVMALQKGCDEGPWWQAPLGLLLLGLALLSKTNALTLLPVALLLHPYRTEGGLWRRSTLRLCSCLLLLGALYAASLPGIALGLCACLLSLWRGPVRLAWPRLALGIAGVAGGLLLWHWLPFEPVDGYARMTEATQLNNVLIDASKANLVRPTALANLGRYLGLFVYPHPLIHMYGYGQVPLVGLGHPLTLLSLGLLIVGLAVCILGLPRREPVAFGLAFFLCTFSIYSNFFVTAPDTMADRFLFLPSLGLCIALVYGLWALAGGLGAWGRARRTGLVYALLLPCLLAAAAQTTQANGDWKSDATLIKNRITYMENSAPAQAMLGFVLYQEARTDSDPTIKQQHYQEALYALHRALAIYPEFYMAWTESGKIFAEVGRYDKAEMCFLKAIQLSPRSPDAHGHLGTMYFFQNQFEPAIPYLENSLSLNPNAEPHLQMLGRAYLQTGRWEPLQRLGQYGRRFFPYNEEYARLEEIASHQLKGKNP